MVLHLMLKLAFEEIVNLACVQCICEVFDMFIEKKGQRNARIEI